MLTPDFPPAHGGIQLLMHRLAHSFRTIDPSIVTLRSAGSDCFDRGERLRVRRVGSLRLGHRTAVGLLNANAFLEARRFKPHVVLSGHVVTSPSAWMIRQVTGRPFVQYVYAQEFAERPRLSAFAVRRADATVAISRHSEQLARAAGADSRRVSCVPPGVDPPNGHAAERSARPLVLTVSRLAERYKGHDRLLDAMPLIRSRVPDVRWLVIGDGPLRKEYEEMTRARGMSGYVRFLGSVSQSERDAWLDHAHVFAMPSRMPGGSGGEGFGIAYLEAGAHGLPVVAGNVGGALDAVVPGETGLLVDPNDAGAVADAISSLLLDPQARDRMGRRGRARAMESGWQNMAAAVERLLEQLAGAQP